MRAKAVRVSYKAVIASTVYLINLYDIIHGMKLIHSAIRTENLSKAVDFYSEVFGLAIREKRYIAAHRTTLVFLKDEASGAEIEIIAEDEPKPIGKSENPSFAHFAFGSENIDDDTARIKAKGYSFLREPFLSMDKSMKIAFMSDPDGNTIEIIEYLNNTNK